MTDGGHPEPGGHQEPAASAAAAEPTAAATSTPEPARPTEATAEVRADRTRQLNRLMRELGLPSGANLPSELAVLRQAMVAEVAKALAEPDSPEAKRRIILKAAVKAQQALTSHKNRLKYGEGLWASAKRALATPLGKILTGSAAIGAGLVVPLSVAAPAAYTGGARLVVEGIRQLTSGEGKLRRELDDAHSGFERRIEAALGQLVITRDRSSEAITRFIRDFVDGVYLRELQALFSLENGFEDAVQARATWQKGAAGKAGFVALAGAMPMDIDGIPSALGAMKGGDPGQHFVAGFNNFYAGSGHWGTVGLLKGNAVLNLGMLAANLASAGIGFGAAGKLIAAADRGAGHLRTGGVSTGVDDAEIARHLPPTPTFHTAASAPSRTVTAPWLTPPSPATPAGPITINVTGGGAPIPPASAAAFVPPATPPPPGGAPPPPPPPPPPETAEQRIRRNDPEFWREAYRDVEALVAANDPNAIKASIAGIAQARWHQAAQPFTGNEILWSELFKERLTLMAWFLVQGARDRADIRAGTFALVDVEVQRQNIVEWLADIDRFDHTLTQNPVIGTDVAELTTFAARVRAETLAYQQEYGAAFPSNTEAVWRQLVIDIDDELKSVSALDPFAVALATGSIPAITYEPSHHNEWADAVKASYLVAGRFEMHIAELRQAQASSPLNVDDIPTVQQQFAQAEQRITTVTDGLLATNPEAAAIQPLRDWLDVHLTQPVAAYQAELTRRLDEWRDAPTVWARLLATLDTDAAADWSALDARLKLRPNLPATIPDPKRHLVDWNAALEKGAGVALVWRSFAHEQVAWLSAKTVKPDPAVLAQRREWERKVRAQASPYQRVLANNPDFAGTAEAQRVITDLTAAADAFLAEISRLEALPEPTTPLLTAQELTEVQAAIDAGPLDGAAAERAARIGETARFDPANPNDFIDLMKERLIAAGRFARWLSTQDASTVDPSAAAAERAAVQDSTANLLAAMTDLTTANPDAESTIASHHQALEAASQTYADALTARESESQSTTATTSSEAQTLYEAAPAAPAAVSTAEVQSALATADPSQLVPSRDAEPGPWAERVRTLLAAFPTARRYLEVQAAQPAPLPIAPVPAEATAAAEQLVALATQLGQAVGDTGDEPVVEAVKQFATDAEQHQKDLQEQQAAHTQRVGLWTTIVTQAAGSADDSTTLRQQAETLGGRNVDRPDAIVDTPSLEVWEQVLRVWTTYTVAAKKRAEEVKGQLEQQPPTVTPAAARDELNQGRRDLATLQEVLTKNPRVTGVDDLVTATTEALNALETAIDAAKPAAEPREAARTYYLKKLTPVLLAQSSHLVARGPAAVNESLKRVLSEVVLPLENQRYRERRTKWERGEGLDQAIGELPVQLTVTDETTGRMYRVSHIGFPRPPVELPKPLKDQLNQLNRALKSKTWTEALEDPFHPSGELSDRDREIRSMVDRLERPVSEREVMIHEELAPRDGTVRDRQLSWLLWIRRLEKFDEFLRKLDPPDAGEEKRLEQLLNECRDLSEQIQHARDREFASVRRTLHASLDPVVIGAPSIEQALSVLVDAGQIRYRWSVEARPATTT